MKKTTLILFIFSSVLLFSTTIEHTYYFNDLQITKSNGYQLVGFENTQAAGLAGEPTLPYQAIQLLLPPGEIAENITITGTNEIQLSQTIDLYPMQRSKPLSSTEPAVFQKNESVYQSKQNYPVNSFGELTTEFMNGFGFALCTVTPVNYIPSSKQLSYFRELTVKIETKPNPQRYSQLNLLSSRQRVLNKINEFAQNTELISSYNTDITREGEYEILIITPNQFISEFEEWISLNLKKGMRTEIAATDDINTTMAGQDLQEKIRNYIIQEYTDNDVQFVLLGGDAELVPPRGFYCYVESGGGTEDYAIPADVYYSGLDGNWNDNGDNLWAEPGEDDLLPDISVARLPFSNSSELATMLGKSLDYQVDPVLGEMQNTLLVGEHLYNDPLTWGGDYMDLLVGCHDDNGYTTDGIPVDHNYETMYDRDMGTWNVPQLMAEINEGKPFIYHAGHCNYSYNMRMDIEDITNANFSQVNGIDHNYSIIYSHGCNCAGFDDDDCIAEEMLKIDNFAVEFVGNSRYGWFNEGQTEGPSEHLNREFTDALYTDKTDLIAQTHLESKIDTSPWVTAPGQWEEGALRWCFYDCNVLGDPTLPIWTDEPQILDVTYDPVFLMGMLTHTVQISTNGMPVEGLQCSIVKDDELYGTATTDATGTAIIDIEDGFIPAGIAQLFVSGYNSLIEEFELQVIPTGYGIYVDDYSISSGNDNVLEFGENASLWLTLEIYGMPQATNMNVNLSTEDEYVTVNDSTGFLDEILLGETVTIDDDFDFDISEDVPDEHQIEFTIYFDFDEGNFEAPLILTAYASDLKLESISVIDNNNSTPDPGEEVTLELEFLNEGGADAYNLIPSISTINPFVSITMLPLSIDSLNAGASETYPVCSLLISEDAPLGEILDFDFELTADNGVYISDVFSLVIGLDIEDFESGDFSSHNWNFTGSSDWFIDTDAYEGFYSAKSGSIENNSFSTIFIILNVTQESEISFWKKVSSEENYDYLKFYVDGDLQDEWSGEVDWSEESYVVQTGNHALQWTYEKDQGVVAGDDCAWIDYILFPITCQLSGLENSIIPDITKLHGNYPNPFNPKTTITFSVAQTSSFVNLEIFNIKGQRVKQLVNEVLPAGKHSAVWNGKDDEQKNVSSGIYFYKLKTTNFEKINKMILLK
ncbi:MAG: hypothetical protein B1H06_03705 [Candidatus Cloacimonas sp. 4484_143]|nr:MAG: hypothetical protein B1H06_03705 [Candidatus Cloacimonas sp. 4484_143]